MKRHIGSFLSLGRAVSSGNAGVARDVLDQDPKALSIAFHPFPFSQQSLSGTAAHGSIDKRAIVKVQR